MVDINPLVWDFIPANAREFKAEVYGWLLGYYADNGEPVILGAYDCQKFVEQTLISAIPDPKQYHEVTVSLPNGIGVLGMYHSHPAGSNIFHSHIDDSTVLDYTSLASNFISIVTNGSDVQCFMLVDKKDRKLKKIEPQRKLQKLPPSTHFRVNLNLRLPVAGSPVEAHNITSHLADMFHNDWGKRAFLTLGSKNKVEEKTPLIKIPEDPSSKIRVVEVDLSGLQGEKERMATGGMALQGKMEIQLFHKDTETIAQVDQKVRNAIQNQLNQRVLKGRPDSTGKAWNLAPIHEISFWNIPLVISFFVNDARKECEEFLKSMVQRIKYISFDKVKQNAPLREQVLQTLKDLEKLATSYEISSLKDTIVQFKKKIM